jgi:hypothetical protein
MMPHTEEWSKIMQEVDRLYHINTTSEGRINCITDYVVRLVREDAGSIAELEATIKHMGDALKATR